MARQDLIQKGNGKVQFSFCGTDLNDQLAIPTGSRQSDEYTAHARLVNPEPTASQMTPEDQPYPCRMPDFGSWSLLKRQRFVAAMAAVMLGLSLLLALWYSM